MSLDNINSIDFTDEEIREIENAFSLLESKLMSKMSNLTPEEKRKYGRSRVKFLQRIEKILMYMKEVPEITPNYIDEEELRKDFENLLTLRKFEMHLLTILEGVVDTSIIINLDIHKAAKAYYQNIKIAEKANVPGITSIYEDLKNYFEKGRKKKKDKGMDKSSGKNNSD